MATDRCYKMQLTVFPQPTGVHFSTLLTKFFLKIYSQMAEVKKKTFKQFNYKGKSIEELVEMPVSEFAKLIPSSCRRHLLRGINKYEDDLIKRVDVAQSSDDPAVLAVPIKTHERSMVILPCMIGCTIAVHCGNGYFPIEIKPEMIGTRLRNYVQTRKIPAHGKPGIGATSGSKFTPLK